jgi:hypothetical protein
MRTNSEDVFQACMLAFLDAEVGLRVPELSGPPGGLIDASGMSLPRFVASDGVEVLRVCADPDVFTQRYDPEINARITGRRALEMLMQLSQEIEGVLLASAASEHSLFISRSLARGLLAAEPESSWWSSWLGRFWRRR